MNPKELICNDCGWIWEDIEDYPSECCPDCGSDFINFIEDEDMDDDKLHPDLPPGNYSYPVY